VTHVISLLENSAYTEKKESQREELQKTIDTIFDFRIMSRMTLSVHWKEFDSNEQEEFARIFGRFLGNTYIKRIQAEFSGEKVMFSGQEILNDKKAVVMTSILGNGVETPIDYSMALLDGEWKIYDVRIEGVSLLKNYRSQFTKILMNGKPRDLIDMLNEKLEER
jgi:phospholipid transport system substrate-binding protein